MGDRQGLHRCLRHRHLRHGQFFGQKVCGVRHYRRGQRRLVLGEHQCVGQEGGARENLRRRVFGECGGGVEGGWLHHHTSEVQRDKTVLGSDLRNILLVGQHAGAGDC